GLGESKSTPVPDVAGSNNPYVFAPDGRLPPMKICALPETPFREAEIVPDLPGTELGVNTTCGPAVGLTEPRLDGETDQLKVPVTGSPLLRIDAVKVAVD